MFVENYIPGSFTVRQCANKIIFLSEILKLFNIRLFAKFLTYFNLVRFTVSCTD